MKPFVKQQCTRISKYKSILQGELIMKKNITKVIIASTVIATGLLTHSNDAKAFFSYEW